MTSGVKPSSAAALRYATALVDLAEDQKQIDQVETDLKDLGAMIDSSKDLSNLIASPLVGKTQQAAALDALAAKAKFQDLTKNFLGVLVQNGRLNMLKEVIAAFDAALAQRRGEVNINIKVAQDLTEAQKKQLQDTISKTVGSDVKLDVQVSADILGGMVITVGSQMIDDSVARKLERLQAAMGKSSNENLAA